MSGSAPPAASASALVRGLQRAQFYSLLLFAVALPLAEAPKNIAAFLVVVLWLARALIARDWGGRWDRFDTALAALLAVALASAAGGYRGGLSDVLRIVLFAWVLKRSALTWDEARRILLAACAALWVGLAIGLFDYARRAEMYLELPSVGHVNQSALYIALLAAATYAWTLQRGFASARERWFVGLSAVVFGASLLITGSRAALLGYGAFVAAFTLAWLLFGPAVDARARRFALGVIAAAAVLVGGLLSIARFLPADPVQVTIGDKLTDQRSMPIRMTHWRLAYEGWRARPWLGHGPDSFRTLRPEQACQWRAQRGQDCDPAAYASTAHAHSLYLATLAERGTLGLLALLLLFGTWGWTLLQSMRREIASPLWAASAVALAVVAVGGSFNTTLRVEHGSLALALLALWLAVRRRAAGG